MHPRLGYVESTSIVPYPPEWKLEGNYPAMAKKDQAESKEIEIRKPSLEQLKALESFADIELLARELGAEIIPSSELGDGFSLLEDKALLIGKPLVLVGWHFSQGDEGEFVSTRVMAREANGTVGKYVINDGGTGIFQQLKLITEAGGQMISAPRGLRKSDYEVEVTDEKTGELVKRKATTFYIDTSSIAKS